jgi:hypothetical protein
VQGVPGFAQCGYVPHALRARQRALCASDLGDLLIMAACCTGCALRPVAPAVAAANGETSGPFQITEAAR